MALTNKLITFNKLTSFETQLAQGNILETSIVFIKDAKKIWTKGTYFDCSGGGASNIAVYETTDDVYNGVLTYSDELRRLTSYISIYTLVIIQKSSETDFRTFVFNSSDKRPPMRVSITYTCVYSEADDSGNTTNLIFYQIARTEGSLILNKHPLALKSDIPNTDDFATQANLSSAVTQLTTNIAKKQDKLVSGTNIATINGNSILGSGNFNLATTDQLRSFQPNLVSGQNIKTINGESILGSGDIVISGGGSSSGSAAYPEVNHGTSDTVLSLAPNTFHIWDEVESLQLVYRRPTAGIANEYLFQFTSGATATTLMLPDTIKWAGGSAPTIQPNMIYQISILNDLGSVLEFDNAPDSIFPVTLDYSNQDSALNLRVFNEIHSTAQGSNITLNNGDLTFVLNGNNISVVDLFYVDYSSDSYDGYVLYDTGTEYYILNASGRIIYFFYD